ncbi:MAG: surface protein [Prevotella sp.]|nr:surface protein [Prevotella sp.]
MNAVSMNNLWTYIQGLSLTASNRKWLAERLIADDSVVPPVLQTMEEALSDIDEAEKEFERGDVLTGEEFNIQCRALIDGFAKK